MFLKVLLFSCILVISVVSAQENRNVFDNDLYKNVLDPELCDRQLRFLATNINSLPFFDAGIRFPRGILKLNFQDLGNFHQCLEIKQNTDAVGTIHGKYCSINVPLQLNRELPIWIDDSIEKLLLDDVTIRNFEKYKKFKRQLQPINGRSLADSTVDSPELSLTLAICIPKVCTSEQAIEFVIPSGGVLNVTERFCRLPDDKPFAAADFVAMAFCGLFLFLIIISTSYDLHYNVFKNRNRKDRKNTLCCSFSLYTNTRRLLTFNYGPDALHCIDGIRSLAMFWVIAGHVFSVALEFVINPLSAIDWMHSLESFWMMSAPITVDTFFLLSGLLLVYTTAEKLNTKKFLRNIHMFYILRYLRLFPILATAVLFQASLVHHLADGPTWNIIAPQVQFCRDGWWWPLLYVQNYVNNDYPCLGVVWYLCVDMQLFWISPLVLVWVLSGSRQVAWLSLGIALFVALLSTSLISFIKVFPSTSFGLTELDEMRHYFQWYYMNTLTRAGPFFVGMIFGYLLHTLRGKKVKLDKIHVFLGWLIAMGIFAFIMFITYPIMQPDYNNQAFDGFLNSYMRSLWALALGWMIFACTHGYGGPINWFLSLNMWKLPARLSYAMYLIHMPLIMMGYSSMVDALHFSPAGMVYRFFAELVITFIVSFALTLAIDSPFSTLQKLLLGGGARKPSPPKDGVLVESKINEKAATSMPGKEL